MIHHQSRDRICCAVYSVGQIEVKASLVVQRTGFEQQYGIILEQEGESAVCEIGSDPLCARTLFFDVVFGGVTACTLKDVVEDRMGTLFCQ